MSEDANVAQAEEPQQTEAEAKVEGESTEVDAGQKQESEADSSTANDDSKPRKGPGKRIDELTRNWREAERERDYWRQQANQREVAKPIEVETKSLADFNYDDKAYQDYLFKQAETRAVDAAKRYAKEEKEATETKQRRMSYNIKELDYAKEIDDYFEVTRNPHLEISDAMADTLVDSEEGPALAYYLGRNPEVAVRIARLSPLAAAREIGRLESKIISEREARKKKVSAAPPPPPKVEGTKAEVNHDPDKMSTAEWMKWRNKQVYKSK